MDAIDTLIASKTRIQDILSTDVTYVLNKLLVGRLITERDYRSLKTTAYISSSSDPAVRLIDKIMNKGYASCRAFITILRSTVFTEQFPDLQSQPWYNSTACGDAAAFEVLLTNKTRIQDALGGNITYVINVILEKRVITLREYRNLSCGCRDDSDSAIRLVDVIMYKGETTCSAFLHMLRTQSFTERFPDLQQLPLAM